MIVLAHNKKYQKFINERDKALEKILNNYRKKISDDLTDYLREVLLTIHRHWMTVQKSEITTLRGKFMIQSIDKSLDTLNMHLKTAISKHFLELRRVSLILSYSSQIEAMTRATTKIKPKSLSREFIAKELASDVLNIGSIDQRLELSLNRMKRDIVDSLEYSRVMGEEFQELIERVKRTFPKITRYNRPPRELKPLKESDKEKASFGISIGDVLERQDADLMSTVIDEEYVSKYRSGKSVFDLDVPGYGGDYKEEWYDWEVENQLSNDFVDQVRAGENEAASQAGIVDFVWIAVIDKDTDECCSKRDGLLVSEIEDKLKNEWKNEDCLDDELDGTIPPIHFNCATSGHKITTIDGEKLIQDIRVGDLVLTHKNRYKKVTRTLQREVKNLVQMTLENGTKLVVTEEHPFLVDGKWVEAKDLYEGTTLTEAELVHKNDT